ncbi:penicillin-binding protein [Bacillus infantis]|uniref:penicillin-binding protein n=1 Tax=Bacillus infantis TaxID=324767 RepID=UPI003CF62C07
MMKKQPNINYGAAILFVIFSLLFFVLLYRFVSIQITGEAGGQPLAAKAEQKYTNERVLEAKRGTIYDRGGDVVAEDGSSFTLVAILNKKMTVNKKKPQHVVDKDKTARELSKVIDLEESEIKRILSKPGAKQVEFGTAGRNISNSLKREIEDLKLPGISFRPEIKRFYPNGMFASHLVGYVEKPEEEDKDEPDRTPAVGRLGIEKSLNTVLSGINGKVTYEKDHWGYLLPGTDEKVKPAKDGNDVYLTIDKKIQTFLEDSMNSVQKEYNPKKMVAIVADPKTGDILAMSQRPSFHPQTREGLSDDWYNEAIEISFEPGSTMKIFTLASAIEEGQFNPNAWYESGTYVVDKGSRPVRDHNYGQGWGSITYLEGVQRSSNVAFAKIAKEQLGFDAFRKYLTRFGFDNPTGINLPNETGAKFAYQYPIEKANTAFGQGTAVTPIQQIQAATAIANKGQMMKPHVIDKIVDSRTGEVIKDTKPESAGKPISEKTAKEVLDILETVVSSEKGTGYKKYNLEGYKVAGKTGTAQIPGSGGYLTGPENYVFSFMGMAPAEDPELVMYVAVQQPQIDDYVKGSLPVSQIFKPVMQNSLQYLNIEPSKQTKIEAKEVPDVAGLSADAAAKKLSGAGFMPAVIGKGGKITGQLPEPGAIILEGERVVIKTDGTLNVPDMQGWSMRDVMKTAKIAGLKLNTVGGGFAVKQNLSPGSPVKEGEFLIVDFETPLEQYSRSAADKEEAASGEDAEEEEVLD